ncbi:MAG: TagF domain-containing protein [Paracoccaceae bacterium]
MREVLSGFHGKLPSAGDFLTRGLPSGFAAFWDGWAARNLAGRDGWPEGGLRLRLASGGRVAAGVVLPGADRVGRRFPLAAFVIAADLPEPGALNPWCDAALAVLVAAQAGQAAPDDLADALEDLPPPGGEAPAGPPGGPAMQLWHAGAAPVACDPAAPGPDLDRLFSCSGSSSP